MTKSEEAKEAIKRIQELSSENFARKELQHLNFNAVVEPAERLIRLYRRLSLSTMDDLPEEYLDAIKDRANANLALFDRILRFESSIENPVQVRDALIKQAHDEYKPTFDQIHAYISYGSSIRRRSTIPSEGRDIAITTVKWLIPSLSVLMVWLGYIAESAHQSLLGFDFGNLGTTEYIWTTGAIMRETLVTLFLAPFIGRPPFRTDFETIFGIVSIVVVLVFVIVTWLDFQKFTEVARCRSLLGVLLVITLVRVGAVDLPLTRIENVLVSGSSSVEKLLSEAPAANVPAVLTQLAARLYAIMVCARDSTVSTQKPPIHCTQEGEYRARLDRIFGTTALSTLIVIGFGIWLFFNSTSSRVAVTAALLVFYSVFALPYAYGKLKRSTEYELAVVQLKTAILDPPSADLGRAGAGASSSPAGAVRVQKAVTQELRLQPAMILVRGDRFVKLYVDHRVTCPNGKIVYEWRFWEGSLSEIVLLREIQRKDVIELKFSKGPPGCEPIESP